MTKRGHAMTSETQRITLIKEKDYGTPAKHPTANARVTLPIGSMDTSSR